jgi:hypothetical protein
MYRRGVDRRGTLAYTGIATRTRGEDTGRIRKFKKGRAASTYHIPMRRVGRFAFWEEGKPFISRTGGNQLPHRKDQVDKCRKECQERPRMWDERVGAVEGLLSNRDWSDATCWNKFRYGTYENRDGTIENCRQVSRVRPANTFRDPGERQQSVDSRVREEVESLPRVLRHLDRRETDFIGVNGQVRMPRCW